MEEGDKPSLVKGVLKLKGYLEALLRLNNYFKTPQRQLMGKRQAATYLMVDIVGPK